MQFRLVSRLAVAGLLLTVAVLLGTAPALARVTARVSLAHDGSEPNADCQYPAVSGDGKRVAFRSAASNLVPGDTNAATDIFLFDSETGLLERVSLSDSEGQANGGSWRCALDYHGNRIAFDSDATNLTPVYPAALPNVYLRDRISSTTTLVSVGLAGLPANGVSLIPSIDLRGTRVAFDSDATNLVEGDTNGRLDIFVRDLSAGTTARVSVNTAGEQANGHSSYPALSPDGRFVVFHSEATNLVPDDTNGVTDVFVHDLVTGETTCVSRATDGTLGNAASQYPSVSFDGRYIAFQSDADNLVAGDTNTGTDIFMHDRLTGATWRVSVASDGAQATGSCFRPAISADGWYVAFEATGDVMLPGDTNSVDDAYVHDRSTRETTTRASIASNGAQADLDSLRPAVSADGQVVAFHSAARNLVPGDTNGFYDIYVSAVEWDQASDPEASPGLSVDSIAVVPDTLSEAGSVTVFAQVTGASRVWTELLGLSRSLPAIPMTNTGGGWQAAINGDVMAWAYGDRLTAKVVAEGASAEQAWKAATIWVERGEEPGEDPIPPEEDPLAPDTVLVGLSHSWGLLRGEARILGQDPLRAQLDMETWWVWPWGASGNLKVWPQVVMIGADAWPAEDGSLEAWLASVSRFSPVAGPRYETVFHNVGDYTAFYAYQDVYSTLLPLGDYLFQAVAAATGLPTDLATPENVLFLYAEITQAQPFVDALQRFDPAPTNAWEWAVAVEGAALDLSELLTNDIQRADLRFVLETSFRTITKNPKFALEDYTVVRVVGQAIAAFNILTLLGDQCVWALTSALHWGQGAPCIVFVADRASPLGGVALRQASSTPRLALPGDLEIAFDVTGIPGDRIYDFVLTNHGATPIWEFRLELDPALSSAPTIEAPVGWEGELLWSPWEHAVRWHTQGPTGWAAGDYGQAVIGEDASLSGFRVRIPSGFPAAVFTVTNANLEMCGGALAMEPGLTVAPPAFTPGDGESAFLEYYLERSAEATLGVWAADECVRTLVPSAPTEAGSYSQMWDGRGDTGFLSSPGEYEVRLTLTYADQSSVTLNQSVTVLQGSVYAPQADFAGDITSGLPPLSVTFSDLSSNAPTSWSWDFGDGGASSEENPSHTYTAVGSYTVSLTVENIAGADTETKPGYIHVVFTDAGDGNWAITYILACVNAGIVQGYPGGLYLPDLPVSRDQMAVFISRALAGGDSSVPSGPETATFSDVLTDHWAFKYVEYAVDNGVVEGYLDGSYRPTETVTRDQMAVFIARAVVGGDAYVPTGPETAFFPDVPTDHWAFGYVEYIRGEGVTNGYPDGTYRPEEAVTRDQMAVYVQRAFALPI